MVFYCRHRYEQGACMYTCTCTAWELQLPLQTTSFGLLLFGIDFTLVKDFPSGKQTRLFNISDPSVYDPGGAHELPPV